MQKSNQKIVSGKQFFDLCWYAKSFIYHLVVRGWKKVGNPWL
jgi:hypothetical protein